jgi:hypothetical protein
VDFFFYLYSEGIASAFFEDADKDETPRSSCWLPRMIRKDQFPACGGHDADMVMANQLLKLFELSPVRHKVTPLWFEPQILEAQVVDESIRGPRGVRAIFKIEVPSVQDQGIAVCVKRYGRKRVVVTVHDKLPGRRLEQCFR